MTALARPSSNCKRQTHPLVRGCYTNTITASVQLGNRVAGRESQGAFRKDELVSSSASGSDVSPPLPEDGNVVPSSF
jgi:hypothetical protein